MANWLAGAGKFFNLNCPTSTLQHSNSKNADDNDSVQISSRVNERSCELSESTTNNSGEGAETDARSSIASNDGDLVVSKSCVTALDKDIVDAEVEEGVAVTSNDDKDNVLTKYVKYEHSDTKNEKERKRSTSDIQTLEDALKHFGLYPRLKSIERSLEEVRRHRKTREAHETDLKRLDKEILQLCYKHHPDRVKNRGGSEEELEEAKITQASLNAIRTVLSVLNKIFLDNIDVDQMYGFYTKLSLSFVGNEDEVKEHVSEVFFKISYLSEIKQQNIIPEIRKFLEAGKDCLKSYKEGNIHDFKKCRDVALSHLKACTVGYIKLQTELETVVKNAKDKSQDNIRELIKKMSSDCARDLEMLREVKHAAKESLNGTCKIFETAGANIDDYFVLPFVYYVNAIIMCNSMVVNENQNVLKTYWIKFQTFLDSDVLGMDYKKGNIFIHPYLLASYFSGNGQYELVVKKILRGKHTDKEEIKKEFVASLNPVISYLDDAFKVENYIEGKRNQFVEDCMRFLKTMDEVDEKERKVRNGIEILENRQRDIEERLEKALKKSMEVSNETKRCFEQDKLHPCEGSTSLFLSENEIDRFEKALKKRAEVRNGQRGCLEQDKLHPDEGSASLLSEIDIFEQAMKKRAEITNETKRCLKQDKLRNSKGSASLFKRIEIGMHEKSLKNKPEASNETKKCLERDILHPEKESESLLKEIANDRLENTLKKSAEVSNKTERYIKQEILHQETKSASTLRETETHRFEETLKKGAEVSNETERYIIKQEILHQEKGFASLLGETEIDMFEKALKEGAEVIFETKRCLEQDNVRQKKRSASPLEETGIDF